ncbi:HNH/endonuclease VII fold putative polymorphic toxin [Rosenbergiella nectarea]
MRDDAGGHFFADDPSQNRGPHFNDEKGNHYDY